MNFFERISEEKIRKAIREGEFEELKGQGQPLPREIFECQKDENTLAFDLLKKNGYLPEWLEERNALLAEIEKLKKQAEPGIASPAKAFQNRILKLNQRILNYNLRAPVPALQINEISISGLAARKSENKKE